MASKTELNIDKHLINLPMDNAGIVADIMARGDAESEIYELQAELPSAMDTRELQALIIRWSELSKALGKTIRVYAWSYNTEVEKHILSMTALHSNILLTILPAYLKRRMYNDECNG